MVTRSKVAFRCVVFSSPKEELNVGPLSQGQSLKRATPGKELQLGALQVGYGMRGVT